MNLAAHFKSESAKSAGEDPFRSSDGRLQVQPFIQSHRHNLSWGTACEQVAGLNTSTTANHTSPVRPRKSRELLLPGRQALLFQEVQEKIKWKLHKQVFQNWKRSLFEREGEEAA